MHDCTSYGAHVFTSIGNCISEHDLTIATHIVVDLETYVVKIFSWLYIYIIQQITVHFVHMVSQHS